MKNHKKLIIFLFLLAGSLDRLPAMKKPKLIEVGVAKIEITPVRPIRLTGYSDRDFPFSGVHHKLWGKALAFGNSKDGYSLLITLDLLGIPGRITEHVRKELAREMNVRPENITICASHTHSGPQIGSIVSHFHKPLSPDELAEVALYSQGLVPKLKEVSLQAIRTIAPARVSWGQGEVGFAVNRREHIKPNGPVDHAMPLLKITDPDGKIRAVLVSYACHAVTLGPLNNVVHGDWVGEAQLQIEQSLPDGAIAMVSVGCGADQNSNPRMNTKNPEMDLENARIQGKSIAGEVSRLIASSELKSLTEAPKGVLSNVDLEFAGMPDPMKLAEDARGSGRTSNYSNLMLGKMARSEMPEKISYPIQVWNFGKDLAMIFLAGEVVVDYSLRLKKQIGKDRVWINAYANDMPCYIPSLRVLKEGGYEAETAMIGYEKPSKFKEDVEEKIINEVNRLLPQAFR
ncbi:neutral/alkaline non-lysosomal ceramidase N-terminal domain-containing protein [Ravibacter arvi]